VNLISILLIATGLAMDAFAVSISAGVKVPKESKIRTALIMALVFGLFQALMPVIGWTLGTGFADFVDAWDHWIALILLSAIGLKMIYEGFSEAEDVEAKDVTNGPVLLILGVATSIDALAVGFTFAFLNEPIMIPVVVIGTVTFLFSFIGVVFGEKFRNLIGKKAEILGGFILIGIGAKIFIEGFF
jgi:putative Mn2+ efflux pump MntP